MNGTITCSVKEATELMSHLNEDDTVVLTIVNKNTKMPSCLIELGFISNWKDNQLFDENIDEYVEAITRGILKKLELQN